eukprot:Hpha_TRINITY_DN15720_c0_g5::TRINITY_DN15720_c0_g5_i1::g.39754::m.39754
MGDTQTKMSDVAAAMGNSVIASSVGPGVAAAAVGPQAVDAVVALVRAAVTVPAAPPSPPAPPAPPAVSISPEPADEIFASAARGVLHTPEAIQRILEHYPTMGEGTRARMASNHPGSAFLLELARMYKNACGFAENGNTADALDVLAHAVDRGLPP